VGRVLKTAERWSGLVIAMVIAMVFGLTGYADDAILAYLGEQPITAGDVDFYLSRKSESAPLSTAAQQAAVELLALQRQALQTLRVLKLTASEDEIDAWLVNSVANTELQSLTAEQIVERVSGEYRISPSTYREFLEFRLSWQAYLAKHLTAANLRKHFDNQRARFDGTRFQIDRMSLPVPTGASPQREQAVMLLTKMRSLVAEQQRAWEESAQEILKSAASDGLPFAAKDVEVVPDTWIEGTGVLPPAIIGQLIQMEVGELSTPVASPTAVHLVRLLAVEKGSRTLESVADEVRAHMLLYLLEHLALQSSKVLPLRSAL
jgi:hypothetical protein